MSNEIAKQEFKSPISATDRGLQLRSIDDYWRFAQYVASSGLAPKGMDKPDQILVAMQAGNEIGLSYMQSLQSIAVVNGRPCVWGDAIPALILASGQCEDMTPPIYTGKAFEDDYTCTVRIKRRGMSTAA